MFVANSLRTLDFTIPASEILAQFAASTQFETGTVAGTITVSITLRSEGSDVTPAGSQRVVTVARSVPVITSNLTVTRTTSGFDIVMDGYSTPREATQAVFNFTGQGGAALHSASLTVDLSSLFNDFYRGSASTQFGSQFRLTVPSRKWQFHRLRFSYSIQFTRNFRSSKPELLSLSPPGAQCGSLHEKSCHETGNSIYSEGDLIRLL